MKTPHERRDGARPAVPPDVEVRPADGPDHRSDTPSTDAVLPPADGQSASDLTPQQKRLLSKAAYRARRSGDDASREGERQRAREWRRKSPEKARAQKKEARSDNYHRPFVSIDSEGQNYPGADILYDGVRYAQHATYLWGAAADDGRATKDEADFIAAMKGRREHFDKGEIDQIKAYTTLELRLLARMMTDLRIGFDETCLRLRHWHGAGAAASALIETAKLKEHYGPDIAALNISPQQHAAHHAYFGGRIELLMQGYMEGGRLHV